MHIEWNITKRRGNIRPILHYTVTLEEHERELALPFIRVVSTIPEPVSYTHLTLPTIYSV